MPIVKDLSIAIITYKRPRQLKLCLDSIKKQKYQPFNTIIIDSYLNKSTIPQSRNLALKKCTTKYLAFIDDDCILDKNWTIRAYRYLSSHPTLAFVVGRTKLLNNHNSIALAQFKNYQEWFNLYHPLDTKNVIFNFNKIKKLRFDPSFKIFEDVDFNQQLKEKNLLGKYNPLMLVSHPEVPNFFSALKKNYIRGQYKAKTTLKWGNFDDYLPSIPKFTNLIDFSLKVSFLLGYLQKIPRPISIVNKNDQGANYQRSQSFYNFLKKHHRFVVTIDSHLEFQKVIASRKYLLIYAWPLLKYRLLKNYYQRQHINFYPRLLTLTMALKASIINRLLKKNHTSLAIIQYPEDMLSVLIKNRSFLTLYDSPTIYSQELAADSQFNTKTISFLKEYEEKVFQNSDYVSFHWYSYFNFAKNKNIKINHPIKLNWGCQEKSKIAVYKTPVKIIYIGKLNSYWVNPPLLSSISAHSNLDIFSYEKPDTNLYPQLSNYKGYLKNKYEKKLASYQFGLITLSKDDLRSQGFSAKYLLYLSYGLPVLCPEWRQDIVLKSATIYYNEKNIAKQIKKYSQKNLWLKKHQAALKLSEKLSSDNTLKPLLRISSQ